MIAALVTLFGAGGALSGLAMAAPLTITCHELIQGAPDPDGNRFVLNGDVLTNFGPSPHQGTFLSSFRLTMLTRCDPASEVSAWAMHRVVGHKVFRTVLWKNRTGKTVRTIHEVFDFDRQAVRDDLDPQDSCHHSGR